MNRLTKWLKQKLGITSLESKNSQLTVQISNLKYSLETLTTEIKAMEKVDIDISPCSRGQNTIILTGAYKGKGYVRFYDLPSSEFIHYVERLKYEGKNSLIRNVDSPPQIRGHFHL